MAETSAGSQNAIDPIDHLPLSLLRSESIPPAPNRSPSSIDWLPHFAGHSWVAYGASSLLVISHFPSPLSPEEKLIGPIFRQVFELSGPVAAVSWCPDTPSSGELAGASENRICLFSYNSEKSKGSFCWSQNALLVQSTKVEAVEWTGSGDGLVAGGIAVVLWKRRSKSWEIAWKYRRDYIQNLICTSRFVEGPSATATSWTKLPINGSGEAGKCVLVCYSNGKSEYSNIELHHPQPISMIQWRPLAGRQSVTDVKHSPRQMLLTCCLDGSVRLWIEVDSGKVRKIAREVNQHKTMRRAFYVAAVIEVNQTLSGSLGKDIFLTWAMQIGGIFKTNEGANQFFPAEEYDHDKVGRCEWLIGFGPGLLVTIWAVHCLDDISPLRFPRVTLWKKQELEVFGRQSFQSIGSCQENQLLLNKVVVLRNSLNSPPSICSLVHLLPCNTLLWSFSNPESSNSREDASLCESQTQNSSSCLTGGVLDMDGHTGRILQVALHPYICEVEQAVSLDSNGLLLLWSPSSISNCISDLPVLIPTWKICGRLVTRDSCSKYTSLSWAPSVMEEERVLLMGHLGGIDCFIIKICHTDKDDFVCHYICTIPFTGHGPYEDGPSNIFSVPLPSSCNKTFRYNKFMLLGIWINEFQALSWEVTLHSYDSSSSCCECNFDANNGIGCSKWKFEGTFDGKKYSVSVYPSSSKLPEPHIHDKVTSFSVVCPSLFAINNDLYCRNPSYIMVTGQSDGSLKLWRSNSNESSNFSIPWELVGMFVGHQSPVSAICLTDCGQKIATITKETAVSTVCIWNAVHLIETGIFLLEDTFTLSGDVVALKWLALGNGQLLLGVGMKNELRVYAQRRCGGQTLLNFNKSLKLQIWFCIAFAQTSSVIRDFLWAPRAVAVVIHDTYFSVYSQWLFSGYKKDQTGFHQKLSEVEVCIQEGGTDEDMHPAMFTDSGTTDVKNSAVGDSSRIHLTVPAVKTSMKSDNLTSSLFVARDELKCGFGMMIGFWSMLNIADKLWGSLPAYHPEALFMNIFSGNWKRAYVYLRHVTEYFTSHYSSDKKHHLAQSSPIVPQMLLSNFFEGHLSSSSNERGFQWGGTTSTATPSSTFQSGLIFSAYDLESYASNNVLNSSSAKTELSGFMEPLDKLHKLAAITREEKMQILAIIDILTEISNPHSASVYENLDEPGRRFWVALRFRQLYILQRFGKSVSVEELVIESSIIAWALHSDCQESLFGSLLPTEPSWQEMRNLGVGYWFTNTTLLRSRMEKLARLQYLKKKDPRDCALLYIALDRLKVLSGLFKISRNEKDKPLVGFLSRNFQEEKHKAAALKNAYVLMGRHQLEMAIAFFLLGGDTSSAISVCAKNLGDEQLALVICRLLEGRGGPLAHHLISKFMLPSATERGDYWLVSLLEWELENYSRSFLAMLGFPLSSTGRSIFSSNYIAFMDPSIGLYCRTLANTNTMKNAVGEQNAATLSRLATLMAGTALNRSGLPLEALEFLSSSTSNIGGTDQGGISKSGQSCILHDIFKPSGGYSSNWLSGNVASVLDTDFKLDLAVQYLSKLMSEHPSWPESVIGFVEATAHYKDFEIHKYEKSLESFQNKLRVAFAQFEQKFSLLSSCLINLMLALLSNNGLLFIGYDLLQGYTSTGHSKDVHHTADSFLSRVFLDLPLVKATEDVSLFSRFIAACSMTSLQFKSGVNKNSLSFGVESRGLDAHGYYFQGIIMSLWSLRTAMRVSFGSFNEDVIKRPYIILDLFEYYIHFASAWLQRNLRGIFRMVRPLLITYSNGLTPYEVDMMDLKKLLHQNMELAAHTTLNDDIREGLHVNECVNSKHGGELTHSIPEDERWKIIGACLWQHMYKFMKRKLNCMSIELDDGYLSGASYDKLSFRASNHQNFVTTSEGLSEKIKLLSLILAKLLKSTLVHISSHHVKQLALFLNQKVETGCHVPTLLWLKECTLYPPIGIHEHLKQDILADDVLDDKDDFTISEILWEICMDPNLVNESLLQENINWSECFDHKPSKGWEDIYEGIKAKIGSDGEDTHEAKIGILSGTGEVGSPTRGSFRNDQSFLSTWQKDTNIAKDVAPFHNPKEIYKKNGELLEALCINSVDQRQAALASSRKGIVFFNYEDGVPLRVQSDCIWSEADWPQNGWAGSESTPVPTCVSPGVGLGSKSGTQLGLGGATVGTGSLERPRRDLTVRGAFGFPGYAGRGASSLGWEIQEEFEEFFDPPPTVETISTRVFSSHPSRPFFLVGSNNTHIYLWEFGKNKATATYGVLPAANVPPPYALACISALQFDPCGHRFASAALDGTLCTWQLEVGGRSNIRPTESSLCFNSHASDVTYITSSGSVIATAGYSTNGANVVIWDTLAPPTTSQASIICHEGGARSISVFDNDIGTGSISPLIVTGGKNGDVGLHDFRYIATGRTKRPRHVDNGEQRISASSNSETWTGMGNKHGVQNQNGMLWYIPKAHLGSVTKISTIPNTSLFLTGSKDGDVKLWDAKAAKLVYQWSKLHERHSFLQPSTRGYSGVVRAAVTDIQVCSNGFLTCGGDGSVKLIKLKDTPNNK